MEENNDHTIYARWLANELTVEEKAELESNGEAAVLRAIIASVDKYRLPELDAKAYEQIRERIAQTQQNGNQEPASEKKETKIIPLYRRTGVIAAAASIALLIGLFWFYNDGKPVVVGGQQVELASTTGQKRQFTLSDKTDIILYGSSEITYDQSTYGSDRKLNLKGEAYFDVHKKGRFEVMMPHGSVLVTGTQFNVLTNDTVTSVRCYEGRVEVTVNGQMTALTPGQGVRVMSKSQAERYDFNPADNDPMSDSRVVENVSLREICTSLSVQYGVTFSTNDVDLSRSFTGTVQGNDLQTALQLIFDPMQIDTEVKGKKVYLKNR